MNSVDAVLAQQNILRSQTTLLKSDMDKKVEADDVEQQIEKSQLRLVKKFYENYLQIFSSEYVNTQTMRIDQIEETVGKMDERFRKVHK